MRIQQAYHDVKLPIKTEMAYLLDGEYGGASVFIVGLSIDAIQFKQSKLRFLSGLGYAIYVAAFDFDDDDSEEDSSHGFELDVKEFSPLRRLQAAPSRTNLAGVKSSSMPDLGLGIWGRNISNALLSSMSSLMNSSHSCTGSMTNLIIDSSITNMDVVHDEGVNNAAHIQSRIVRNGNSSSNLATFNTKVFSTNPEINDVCNSATTRVTVPVLQLSNLSSQVHQDYAIGIADPDLPSSSRLRPPSIAAAVGYDIFDDVSSAGDFTARSDISALVANIAPTWEPAAPFCFPVAEIPAKYTLMDDLTLSHLSEIKHLTNGSNSNIFLGKLGSEKVIIKMIKEELHASPVAMHEFDLEHGMLCRISHPHIIKVLGAGRVPRRFIVLEYLGGGSLNSILAESQHKPGLAQRLFHKPSFNFVDLLYKARDMADALDYLHSHCHVGASIIHRGEPLQANALLCV
jgi:hypothetical protein